jgi:hypothetical protein
MGPLNAVFVGWLALLRFIPLAGDGSDGDGNSLDGVVWMELDGVGGVEDGWMLRVDGKEGFWPQRPSSSRMAAALPGEAREPEPEGDAWPWLGGVRERGERADGGVRRAEGSLRTPGFLLSKGIVIVYPLLTLLTVDGISLLFFFCFFFSSLFLPFSFFFLLVLSTGHHHVSHPTPTHLCTAPIHGPRHHSAPSADPREIPPPITARQCRHRGQGPAPAHWPPRLAARPGSAD